MRRYSVCHIMAEWNTKDAHWTEMWCGKRSFLEHDFKPDPKEEAKLDAKQEDLKERPWKHCAKCIKAKKKAKPGWEPKTES
ncbi:MAG: hypothetical protein IPO08_20785 [Xanthomonadales bacterium]|nr:hypothetical protein [Xanthomonadales bacterium]